MAKSYSLDKFVKENISSSFTDNEDGTVTVKFGGTETKLGKTAANLLKQIIQKKLSGNKYAIGADANQDLVDRLNQMAHVMIQKSGITPQQRELLKIQDELKNKKLT